MDRSEDTISESSRNTEVSFKLLQETVKGGKVQNKIYSRTRVRNPDARDQLHMSDTIWFNQYLLPLIE